MPSGLVAQDTWWCKPCDLLFSTAEKLQRHKAIMRDAGKPKHIHCKFCGEDFKTENAERTHIQQNHPNPQSLHCPACNAGPFIRLGGFMDHVEHHCTRLDTETLAVMRDRKLEFARQLEALTKQSIKHDYAGFMPNASGAASVSNSNHRGRSTETKTLTGRDPITQPAKQARVEGAVPKISDVRDRDHPDHPCFKADHHYVALMGEYLCPRPGCGKSFKTSGGLISHLRSAARHFGNIYQCPYCLKSFGSLTAVTQHAETSTVRCRIRETDQYNAYLDQLSGGLVNVAADPHDDGTPKYETTESSKQKLGRGSTVSGSVVGTADYVAKKEKYWADKDIHW